MAHTAAVDQLSTFLVDVEAWLKVSRLRLNPAKTQVSTTACQVRYGRHISLVIQCTGPGDGS